MRYEANARKLSFGPAAEVEAEGGRTGIGSDRIGSERIDSIRVFGSAGPDQISHF